MSAAHITLVLAIAFVVCEARSSVFGNDSSQIEADGGCVLHINTVGGDSGVLYAPTDLRVVSAGFSCGEQELPDTFLPMWTTMGFLNDDTLRSRDFLIETSDECGNHSRYVICRMEFEDTFFYDTLEVKIVAPPCLLFSGAWTRDADGDGCLDGVSLDLSGPYKSRFSLMDGRVSVSRGSKEFGITRLDSTSMFLQTSDCHRNQTGWMLGVTIEHPMLFSSSRIQITAHDSAGPVIVSACIRSAELIISFSEKVIIEKAALSEPLSLFVFEMGVPDNRVSFAPKIQDVAELGDTSLSMGIDPTEWNEQMVTVALNCQSSALADQNGILPPCNNVAVTVENQGDKGSARLRPAALPVQGKYATFLMLQGMHGVRGIRASGVMVGDGGVRLDGRGKSITKYE